MNKDMREIAAGAIKIATDAGAWAAAADITSRRRVEIGYRERKPETIKESSTRDLQLSLYVDGRYSAQGTSDLRPAALKRFVTDAVAATRLIAPDPMRTLPDPKYYQGRVERDLGLVDPAYSSWTAADRHAWAKTLEAACLARGKDRLVSVSTQVSDSHVDHLRLASNGFEGVEESTFYQAVLRVTAQDQGDRRPNGFNFAVAMSRKALPSPEEIGAVAADRTLALLGAKKIKTETLPIIIENRGVDRVIGSLLEAMSGRAVQQKQSFLADKKGQRIASELLTLVDDPFVPGGLGSSLFDGEGMTAKRRVMIDAGVLKELWVSWYYSRKLGCEPTSGGSFNLLIPPGKRSVAEIMKDLGRGILITDFIGGNSNSTTGDASVGISGQLFDKGQIAHPVSEMNIAGNTLAFWSNLVEVANDPWLYGGDRYPSLVFKDVVVAGV
ncbi:MAG: TldD/PmbA family protein [Thermoanaerobaculaceae bacterium]|jgi:PmbA protein|nr:TldD/PmbA family protein [Thermoanaerobaculaceae bacterium]